MIASVLGPACHAGIGLLLLAHGRPAPAQEVKAYWALVEEYRAGDSDEAIDELLTWTSGATERAAGKAASTRKTRDPSGHRSPPPFPAAIMLHTEAGLRLNWRGDTEGATRQWRTAMMLVEAAPAAQELQAFLRDWYRALALFFLGSHRLGDPAFLLERARVRFPGDPAVELALGQAYEARGTLSGPEMRSEWSAFSTEARADLLKAEGLYRGLLFSDPDRLEARLRLGRVLQVSARPELALAELRRVAATAVDLRALYLAHLFAGDALRRQSRMREARDELASALEAWPGGQAAALGLAEIQHSMGERDLAASTLATTLAGDAGQTDPFRTYYFGDHAEQRRLLEAVKAMARTRP